MFRAEDGAAQRQTAWGGDDIRLSERFTHPLIRLWQAGRDDGTDHNGTFSRPLTDWKGSPCSVRKLWQSGGTGGAMMRISLPQPVAIPFPIYLCMGSAGERGKYGGQDRNQIQWAGSVTVRAQARLIHVVLIDRIF